MLHRVHLLNNQKRTLCACAVCSVLQCFPLAVFSHQQRATVGHKRPKYAKIGHRGLNKLKTKKTRDCRHWGHVFVFFPFFFVSFIFLSLPSVRCALLALCLKMFAYYFQTQKENTSNRWRSMKGEPMFPQPHLWISSKWACFLCPTIPEINALFLQKYDMWTNAIHP